MTIRTEIQSLSPTAIIEVFTIDATSLGGTTFNFHAGTNKLLQSLVWQGITYSPLPIEAEGFELTSKGTLPRPKIRVANTNGLFSSVAGSLSDLVGARVTRKRTFAKYLDAVNYPLGNINADVNQYLPDELWFVEAKTVENRYIIEWELSSAFDLMGVMLPSRQVIQNSCSWKYRSAECGYMGGYMDVNDAASSQVSDQCSKRLTSCQARFGVGILPFGGFPGAVRFG